MRLLHSGSQPPPGPVLGALTFWDLKFLGGKLGNWCSELPPTCPRAPAIQAWSRRRLQVACGLARHADQGAEVWAGLASEFLDDTGRGVHCQGLPAAAHHPFQGTCRGVQGASGGRSCPRAWASVPSPFPRYPVHTGLGRALTWPVLRQATPELVAASPWLWGMNEPLSRVLGDSRG